MLDMIELVFRETRVDTMVSTSDNPYSFNFAL